MDPLALGISVDPFFVIAVTIRRYKGDCAKC
jgi:hypothetical protein